VWIGSALMYHVPVGALRMALAVLLVGASLALAQKAGANIPTAVIAAFPIGVGILFLIAYMRSRRTGLTDLVSVDSPTPEPRQVRARAAGRLEIPAVEPE
jgi:hypothetical protein